MCYDMRMKYKVKPINKVRNLIESFRTIKFYRLSKNHGVIFGLEICLRYANIKFMIFHLGKYSYRLHIVPVDNVKYREYEGSWFD